MSVRVLRVLRGAAVNTGCTDLFQTAIRFLSFTLLRFPDFIERDRIPLVMKQNFPNILLCRFSNRQQRLKNFLVKTCR